MVPARVVAAMIKPYRNDDFAPVFIGATPLSPPEGTARGAFVDREGERWFEISQVDTMTPFLITVASASDHWMFVSSTGALTAGRRDPDHALFPYTTDDRLHDSAEHAGGKSILRVHDEQRRCLWEPLSLRGAGLYRTSRRLAKNVTGNQVCFEEVNHDLGLAYACTWMTSDAFGFVRRISLRNDGAHPRTIDLLDGVQNLLPAGIERRFQMEYSTLGDAYKDSERDPASGLGIFRLASIPVDAATPSEALLATTVWSAGLDDPLTLLSSAQLDPWRYGQPVTPEARVRGQRGAFFSAGVVTLAPGETRRFYTVADVTQDAAAVVASAGRLRSGADPVAEVEADVARGSAALRAIVARADGLAATADELETTRHFANVLFNCMRGGVPAEGYQISRDDYSRFLSESNRRVFGRSRTFLSRLCETLPHRQLIAAARVEADPDLERLTGEYLPLTFSRRHGDPSRPWNIFSIAVKDNDGQKLRGYQGNWRDIFQNWEALALSFPDFIESMIFKFLDASTADGHNPYRVTREGFEWEVKDPRDPWSHIGYWGDHQVIYLLRLLELSQRYHPGRLSSYLARWLFTYANVPYRIAPYDALVRDPQDTIFFDQEAHQAALERTAALGAEGKTLLGADRNPVRANLTEKLLVLVLAKLGNYVPDAGIWMNTQRPEWNDAQNALVGNGASLVTLAHLRRFLAFMQTLFAGGDLTKCEIAAEVAQAFQGVAAALRAHEYVVRRAANDADRRTVLDAVARPMSEYRGNLYAKGFSGATATISAAEVIGFCETALRHVDHSIAANRRGDGLYHAYNLIKIGDAGISVRRLPEMLEGQVAVLSSGALYPEAGLALLDALAESALYRADQQSYLLYPDRQLPAFLAKNRIPHEAVAASPLLAAMIERRDRRIVVCDSAGDLHFAASFRNAKLLGDALAALPAGDYGTLPVGERQALLALYEQVFDHQSFTGRAGSFYKYEGLGCIYWHLNSKLLVAVQELLDPVLRATTRPAVVAALRSHHEAIRAGLGLHKTPAVHGAFPTDPYSHTPAHAGAQQPGLTGQVKEDVIARARALGVVVAGGQLGFDPVLLARHEFLTRPAVFSFLDVDGTARELPLPPGSLGFTICQVPVSYRLAAAPRIVIERADGSRREVEGLTLDLEVSQAIFDRAGEVRSLEVFLTPPMTSSSAAAG